MKKVFFYPFLIFLVISIAVFLYGFYTSFTSNSFIILKPITAFQYSVFLTFVFGLLAFQDRIEKDFTLDKKKLYIGLGFFFAMASLFETLWNFHYWFSLYTLQGTSSQLDNIKNLIMLNNTASYNITSIVSLFANTTSLQNNGIYPINLNLSTKGWFVIFFGALYWIYFVIGLKPKERKNESLPDKKM